MVIIYSRGVIDLSIQNIDELIELVNKKVKGLKNIRKWDGISVECMVSDSAKIEKIKLKIQDICESNQLMPVSFENNEIDGSIFLFQLPDFEPVYTEEQIKKLYIELFNFLINNFLSHKDVDNSVQHLLDIHENMVKLAIKAFYRSNVNKYHVKESDLLDDVELRLRLNDLYKHVVMEFNINKTK